MREAQGCGANLRGAPGILGRRAQGEAGGNRGRERGRAVVRAGKEELTTWVPRVSGRGVARRLRRQAPTCGPALPAERRRARRRMWRWASAGVACAAGERDGPLRAGPKERVLGRRRERERDGPAGALGQGGKGAGGRKEMGCGFGLGRWVGFLFYFFFSSISNQIQLIEFKLI